MADIYSSSESILALVVVTGVGGVIAWVATEAASLLGGEVSPVAELIDASAAFRFLSVGGMVAAGNMRV